MSLFWLLCGLFLGGAVSFVALCCLQVGRLNEHRSEVVRLRGELDRMRKM